MDVQSQSSLASLWYCRIHGLERGPLTWDMLQDLARGGDLRPSDLVRRGDESQWTLASQARYDAPPRVAAPVESKLTAQLAAALSADVLAAHVPATVYKRELATVALDDGPGAAPEADPEFVPIPASQPSVDEDGPVLTLTDEPAVSAATPQPTGLPAAAAAHAARHRRSTNPAGIALLALGLALVGLFKLALPLGLLSLYLAWRSAADLRRRPQARGAVPARIGLATAAAAMAVAGVDVGVSVYHIAGRW